MTDAMINCMAGFIPECNISFNGGNLSSDSGAILPLDFILSNSLLHPCSSLPFSDDRGSCSQRNSNFSLLAQQVFKYILGYFTQVDQAVLAQDPILSRYFKRISSETLNAFWPVFMDQACQFACACQDDILIDADSTKTDTYGNQEGSSWIHHYQQTGYHPFVVNEYNTGALLGAWLRPDADSTKTDTYGNQEGSSWIHHYQQTGYHPFVVNEYNTGALLGAWLRPGSAYSADEAEAIMTEVLKRIPDRTANGKMRQLRFRGDAAFYSKDLMNLFEERNNSF